MNNSNVSLWSLAAGVQCELQSFDENLPSSYQIRLQELGFQPGNTLQCLQTPKLGAPRVYRVSNTVYSLDKSIAERLLVKLTA